MAAWVESERRRSAVESHLNRDWNKRRAEGGLLMSSDAAEHLSAIHLRAGDAYC